MMFGSAVLPVMGVLNHAFGGVNPSVTYEHRGAFAPGENLGKALQSVLGAKHEALIGLLAAYVGTMPGGFQESLRAIIHYALSKEPQVLLTFSWAPAYDFEMNVWEVVEPAPAHSGMTIAIRGRYPDELTRFGAA